jgi:hypothetical protein
MAQTKRKRQTKHRGNAAGSIESRGRTGRKPTAAEKRGDAKAIAKEKAAPVDRRDEPPTWRSAFIKAMFAGVAFLVIFAVFIKHSGNAIALFPFVIGFYTLISFYTDKFVYERRMRNKAKEQGRGKGTS